MKAVIKVNTNFTIEIEGFDKGNEVLERIQSAVEALKANGATDMVTEVVNTRIMEALSQRFDYYDKEKGLMAGVSECDLGTNIEFVSDKGDEQ